MVLKVLVVVLGLAAITSDGPQESKDAIEPKDASVPISDAVREFNETNEASRTWADESPLTQQELIAAIVHEKKTLSAESQQIANQIIQTRSLPANVRLKVFGRKSADHHKTYIYFIELGFDKGPAKDEEGKIRPGRRRVENLIVRKRYLATQKSSRVKKMKSLEELLTSSGH